MGVTWFKLSDLRLYGIVLAKLLIFGGDVDDMDLFDFRTGKVTAELKSSVQSYRDMIDLCFHKDSTAPPVFAFLRSMLAHFFQTKDAIEESTDGIIQHMDDMYRVANPIPGP